MEDNLRIPSAGEKNKRILRNIVSYLLNMVTSIAFGLIVPRLFLVNFGSEVNGLVNTVRQIIIYLSILEAGVGLSSQQALYRPVAEGDRNSINAIVAAMHHYYRRTGIIYLTLSVTFAVCYPLLIHTGLSYVTVFVIILMYALPEVLKYFVQGKFRIFLEVEGKSYIISNISTVMLWVCNILRIVTLLFTDNLILIQATYCLPSIAQLFIVVYYIKKHYGWLNVKVKPDLASLKQKNSVLVHQISGMIFNNTDTVLISIVCGLKEASVYTVYTLFFGNIDKLIHAFTDGINFRLGQIFSSDKKKFFKLYDLYEEAYIMCVFIMYTVIVAFLLPIISLYTKGINDVTYIDPRYVILFAAVGVLANTKYPAHQLISYSGDFNTTSHHAVIEMILNLVVSVIASLYFGIVGCLAGTVVALVYRNIAVLHFTTKRILNISCFTVFRRILVNVAISVCILLLIGTQSCEPKGYGYVLLRAIPNALWIGTVFLVLNVITNLKTFRTLPEYVRKVIKK